MSFANNQEEMRAQQSLGASQFLAVADGVMKHFIHPQLRGIILVMKQELNFSC